MNDAGPIDVLPVLGPWDEVTLSASVTPPLGLAIGSLSISTTDQGRFVTVDVTTLAQGWLDGSITDFGIALLPTTTDPVRITLDSKESTGTSHAPELEVTPVGPEGPPGRRVRRVLPARSAPSARKGQPVPLVRRDRRGFKVQLGPKGRTARRDRPVRPVQPAPQDHKVRSVPQDHRDKLARPVQLDRVDQSDHRGHKVRLAHPAR